MINFSAKLVKGLGVQIKADLFNPGILSTQYPALSLTLLFNLCSVLVTMTSWWCFAAGVAVSSGGTGSVAGLGQVIVAKFVPVLFQH